VAHPRTLDHLYHLVGMVNIRTKEMSVEPLDLDGEFAWAQREVVLEAIRQYNAGKPVRIIVLKARQLGLSTIATAIFFNWILIFKGASALEIAHDTETSQSLFEKIQDAWEWWPFKDLLHLRHSSARRLTIDETGSSVRIATARNVKTGRGRTINALHASEMSFWDDPETLMTGLSKTVPRKRGSIIIIECTANGVGNLYWEMWTAAVAGLSDYEPLFFPWWKHPEYTTPADQVTLRQVELDKYERWLFEELHVDLARLQWRRWAIVNECHGDVNEFRQEYPATPDEAFLQTGRNLFPLEALQQKTYQPKNGVRGYLISRGYGEFEFVRDPMGQLTIFRWPSRDANYGDYMVAGDPTRTEHGDPACIQVLNRRTFEQVAVWHGQVHPVPFADRIMELGYYYRTALISCEIEGPGYATIGAIMAKGYPRVWRHRRADVVPGRVAFTFGWSTNTQRKNQMVFTTQRLIIDGSLTIHDQETYEQLRDFAVINDNGAMGHQKKDGHDDAVMAICQACVCSINEIQPEAYVPPRHGQRPARRGPDVVDIGGVAPYDAFNEPGLDVADVS